MEKQLFISLLNQAYNRIERELRSTACMVGWKDHYIDMVRRDKLLSDLRKALGKSE
jgi:hypothetical protein